VKRSVIPKKSFGAAKNAKLRSSHFDLDKYPSGITQVKRSVIPKRQVYLSVFFVLFLKAAKQLVFSLTVSPSGITQAYEI